MAFLWFAEAELDLVIMEAGMGGSSDATTVAEGFMTLLTPISLDHAEYLGDSPAGIAREKAGAIRPGQRVVVAGQTPDVLEVIDSVCAERGLSPLLWGRDFSAVWEDGLICYRGGAFSCSGIRPGVPGAYQLQNAAVALAAAETLHHLGFPLFPEGAVRGIGEAHWPGRMELVPGATDVYLDGAHNPEGAKALAESLRMLNLPPCRLVLGCMADKDLAALCIPLAGVTRKVYTVTPRIERALPAVTVAACCRSHGLEAVSCGSLEAGLEMARVEALPGEPIVVAGSLFLVGEARALLLGEEYQPVRG
jgi:dihydrofolate synthase/folylpolyglutamate synthase